MLSIEALKVYGADTQAGLARCQNDETLYLGLVEMLMNDRRFDDLNMAVQTVNLDHALHMANALSETASGLALIPMVEQIDQMILCLQVKGDSALLEKQLKILEAGLEKLRAINMT